MGNKRNYNPYSSIEQKSFRSALFQFMQREYGFLMGKLALERFCEDVEGLVEKYYPRRDRIKAGQMMWYAVAEGERPSYGKRMEDTEMVPVVLTVVGKEDIVGMKEGRRLKDIKRDAIVRLFTEAKEQGGVLSELDAKVIVKMSSGSISRYIRGYESESGRIVPRRGTVHDIGRSVSHKRVICYKRFAKRYSPTRIARETYHSLQEVEKYLYDYKRVRYCLLRGIPEEQISFVLKMSSNLVKEYVEIIKEINEGEVEKELENDLVEYKISLVGNTEGIADNFELDSGITKVVSGGDIKSEV